MSNQISVGRFNRNLQRLFELKAEPPAPDIAAEIMPVITLESDRPEWHWLQGGRLCVVSAQITGVAGQQSMFRLRNPSTSSVIAVVEFLAATPNSTLDVVLLNLGSSSTTTDFGTLLQTNNRDSRAGTAANNQSACIASSTTGGSLVGNFVGRRRTPADAAAQWSAPGTSWILAPGGNLDVSLGSNNISMTVEIHWRERFLEQSER